jgi:hypothetical protein
MLNVMSDSVCYRNNRARWTLKDLTFLENNYSSMPVAKIAVRLGRTPGAVGLMVDKLGCCKKKSAPWGDIEMDSIRDHYSLGVEARSLTRLLPGRSAAAIFSMVDDPGGKVVVSGGRRSSVFLKRTIREWALRLLSVFRGEMQCQL